MHRGPAAGRRLSFAYAETLTRQLERADLDLALIYGLGLGHSRAYFLSLFRAAGVTTHMGHPTQGATFVASRSALIR